MISNFDKFKRGNFFTGLMATPKFWNDIQEYNFRKEQFYNKIFSGVGVVPGFFDELKITPLKKGGNLTIVVEAGFAIDGYGRSIFLYEPEAKIIDYKRFKLPTTIYITIKYNEELDEFYQSKENPEFQGYQKKVESAIIEITTKIPDNINNIELSRIYLEEDENGEIKDIKIPENIANPLPNEIDIRFVLWLPLTKKGISPYLKNYLIETLDDTKTTAAIANDAITLPGLRELQTIALTAKMLVQCGDISYDDISNILYPLYDINSHVIQEMLDYEIREEKRVFSTKDSFNDFRTKVHEMGDLIKYFDNKLETVDQILKCQKKILENIRNIIVFKKITLDDISLISYELPRVLVIGNDRYTMVEFLDFSDFDTERSHDFDKSTVKDFTTAKQAFSYPDGREVRDVVLRYAEGKISFTIRNLVKKRELLIIRRTDIFHGNYKVEIEANDELIKQLVIDGFDTKNRWRNLALILEDNVIKESSIKIAFKMGKDGKDNFGKIWFYQKLI